MGPRATTRLYHTAARLWLTAALISLLLPPAQRYGLWMPLHLALAGAISVAISGAMQTFVSALTATKAPPPWVVWLQFGLVNLGAALAAFGYPAGRRDLLAVGGVSFVAGVLVLGGIVLVARRRALNRRHRVPLLLYLAAVAAVAIGGTFGALIGSGAIDDPDVWLALRRSHMVLNVLGWVALTILGTIVTLLPTVLRVRMPPWHGRATAGLLVGAVAAVAAGLGLRWEPLAAAGGLALVAGLVGVGWLVVRVIRTPRSWPVPAAAKHLLAGQAWFALGSVWLAVALVRGTWAFDGFREPFLAIYVGGFAIQVLLGAWQYLLPMGTPGHPDDRRRFLAVGDLAGTAQVLVLNVGVALVVLRAADLVPGAVGRAGALLALTAGSVALAKAWLFPLLARSPLVSARARDVWGA